MVLKFLVALLRSNRSTQDEFFRRQLPESIFPSHSAVVHWVYNFRSQHGVYPSLSAVKTRFPDLVFPNTRDSAHTAIEEILDHYKFSEIQKAFNAAKKELDAGKSISSTFNLLKGHINGITDFSFASEDRYAGSDDSADDEYRRRVKLRHEDNAHFCFTPWPQVNSLLGMSEYGDHMLLAARTSLGKTWLALVMAYHHALMGERVLFTSKEMTTNQLYMRLEALIFKLHYGNFKDAKLPPRELRRWRHEKAIYKKTPIAKNFLITGMETVKGTGMENIIAKIEEFRPTSVWVDGAYLIHHPGQKFQNDVQRFTVTSNLSKRYAKAYKVFWCSVVQGNRDGENSAGDTRVSLKDIYGADAWAQDSSTVFLLGGKRGSNSRILSLAKSRESAIGDFNIGFSLSPPNFPILLGGSTAGSASTVSFTTT